MDRFMLALTVCAFIFLLVISVSSVLIEDIDGKVVLCEE